MPTIDPRAPLAPADEVPFDLSTVRLAEARVVRFSTDDGWTVEAQVAHDGSGDVWLGCSRTAPAELVPADERETEFVPPRIERFTGIVPGSVLLEAVARLVEPA